MTKPEIESEMVRLQNRMNELQQAQGEAYRQKLLAEERINSCGVLWYGVYSDYEKLKQELAKLNK